MDGSVFHLIYVSSAVSLMDQPALERLLKAARAKNRRLGVTGMLLYHDGNFMQALEGEEAGVLALAGSIASDPRHKDMQVVVRYATDAREFAGWDMAFHQLGANDAETPDFVDLTRDHARLERGVRQGRHRPPLARPLSPERAIGAAVSARGSRDAEMAIEDNIRRMPEGRAAHPLEGTLEPELIFALAERNGVELPYRSRRGAARRLRFRRSAGFPRSLLRRRQRAADRAATSSTWRWPISSAPRPTTSSTPSCSSTPRRTPRAASPSRRCSSASSPRRASARARARHLASG